MTGTPPEQYFIRSASLTTNQPKDSAAPKRFLTPGCTILLSVPSEVQLLRFNLQSENYRFGLNLYWDCSPQTGDVVATTRVSLMLREDLLCRKSCYIHLNVIQLKKTFSLHHSRPTVVQVKVREQLPYHLQQLEIKHLSTHSGCKKRVLSCKSSTTAQSPQHDTYFINCVGNRSHRKKSLPKFLQISRI